MAWDLKPSCDFLFGYPCCALPEDTIDVELTMRTVKGIHTSWKDHTTKSTTCSSWSRWMKSFPSFCRKIQALEEEKRHKNIPFSPSTPMHQKICPHKRTRERSQKRSKSKKLDMGHFTPSKACL